jgi:hypothetical protein
LALICLKIYSINLIVSVANHNMKRPHTIGIQKPCLWVLIKPMAMDITERKTRYKLKRERKNSRVKVVNLFIIQSYLRSFERGILPPS